MQEFLNAGLREVRIWANAVFILISLKTEIARSVRGPNISAEDAMAEPFLVQKILVPSSSWLNAKPFHRNADPQRWAAKHYGFSGNVFANPDASSSAPYPQELNPWSSHISEPIHSSPAGKNENQTTVQDQRCQSGPSAKNSFIPSEGDSSKNYGQTNNDCRSQILKEVEMVESVDDFKTFVIFKRNSNARF